MPSPTTVNVIVLIKRVPVAPQLDDGETAHADQKHLVDRPFVVHPQVCPQLEPWAQSSLEATLTNASSKATMIWNGK